MWYLHQQLQMDIPMQLAFPSPSLEEVEKMPATMENDTIKQHNCQPIQPRLKL